MDNPFRSSRIMTCTQQTKCSKYFVLLRSFLFDIPRAMFFWLYNPDNYLKKTSAMKQNNKFSYWKNNYIRNTVAKYFLQITKQILYHVNKAPPHPLYILHRTHTNSRRSVTSLSAYYSCEYIIYHNYYYYKKLKSDNISHSVILQKLNYAQRGLDLL